MRKVLRVKDLFNQIDEKYGIRMSEVGLLEFLPSNYCAGFISRNSQNHCYIFLATFDNEFPVLNCSISYNAPLSFISDCCSDFKLV